MLSRLLFITLLVPMLAACGGEYAAEKMLWKADRMKKTIAENPEATPAGLWAKCRETLEEILRRHPSSAVAPAAQFALGELYALQGDEARAAQTFQQVPEKYPGNKAVAAASLFAVARIHEKAGRRDESSRLCRDILEDYPMTPTGLQLPLYLARKAAQGKDPRAGELYQDAIRRYGEAAGSAPRTPQALQALQTMFQCQAETGRWRESLKTLQKIIDDYPNTPAAVQARVVKIRILRGLERKA